MSCTPNFSLFVSKSKRLGLCHQLIKGLLRSVFNFKISLPLSMLSSCTVNFNDDKFDKHISDCQCGQVDSERECFSIKCLVHDIIFSSCISDI